MSSRLHLTKFLSLLLYRTDLLDLCQSLSSTNCILKLTSHFAISNPMSAAGKKYRSFINDDGECNNSRSVMKWTNSRKIIENRVSTIKDFIDIRDCYK